MTKGNIRSERTREALRVAILNLIGTKPAEEIAVREIARHAGVTSQTFYRYYKTKHDLLNDIAPHLIKDLAGQVSLLLQSERNSHAAARICKVVSYAGPFWRNFGNSGSSAQAQCVLEAHLTKTLTAEFPAASSRIKLITRLAAHDVIETLDWWLEEPDAPTEWIASMLEQVCAALRSRLQQAGMRRQDAVESNTTPETSSDSRTLSKGEKRKILLVNTAERLIAEEGHGSLTTRRLSEETGVRLSLVHYYFKSTDDLLLDVYKRANQRSHSRTMDALAAKRPLSAYWQVCNTESHAILGSQFYALSSHRPRIREAVNHDAFHHRNAEAQALREALPRLFTKGGLNPQAVVLLLSGVSRFLSTEASIGVTGGHQHLMDLVDQFISDWEQLSLPTNGGVDSAKDAG